MSIVSSVYELDGPVQQSGRQPIKETHTDSIAGEHTVRYKAPSGADYQAIADARATKIGERLAGNEESVLESQAESDVPITSAMVLGVQHSTAKKTAKKLIRFMMRTRNPWLVIALEPLIIYLRATYTNPQLLNFLDITASQGTKMNARINEILDNKSVFTTFDANQEEID